LGGSDSQGPVGSRDSFTPPLAHGTYSTPFPPTPPPAGLTWPNPPPRRATLGPSSTPAPTGVAPPPVPGKPFTLEALPPPTPFAFPPLTPVVGPANQPPLPQSCPDGFFGDPPTRKTTSGDVLTPAEVVRRQGLVSMAIGKVRPVRPLSAEMLQNWLDGKSVTKVMSSAEFLKDSSGTPQFLGGETRDKFKNACNGMLKNRSDPHGTLLPDTLTAGAVGPVRFLQYESGVNPLDASLFSASDLYTAIGRYNVHSAVWVQATYTGKQGAADVFDVKVLRWCAQAYDVYNWNRDGTVPFPLSDADYKIVEKMGNLGAGAYISNGFLTGHILNIEDRWFRDLEVSGGGRSFLVRSQAFEAPQSVTGNFTISIDQATTPTQ
jgi:hypothetical protein